MYTRIDYGEILFVGKCNYQCYYCLSNEMEKLGRDSEQYEQLHFSLWPKFSTFLDVLRKRDCNTIFLSSTNSEPLLYPYIEELVPYLKSEGFTVGIRTNGTMAKQHLKLFNEFDNEISISLNSLNPKTNEAITKSGVLADFDFLLTYFAKQGIQTRITIVIVEENYREVQSILDLLSGYKSVSYVQLRKRYKYYEKTDTDVYYESVKKWIQTNCIYAGNFHESAIYQYKNLKVSLWLDVFRKESIRSLNYFNNGILTENNLLVEAYEEDEHDGCDNLLQ